MMRFVVVCAGVLGACLLGGCGGGGGGGGGGDGGVISFSAPGYSVNEDGTTITAITVQRVGGTGDVSITVTLIDSTATAPSDYANPAVVLAWLAGDTSDRTFVVPIVDDHDDEPNEVLTMTLGSPTGGAAIGPVPAATLTIVDDDVAGTVQFSAAAYSYAEDGTTADPVAVTRTGGMDGAISVTVVSVDGTANGDPMSLAEPVDFTAVVAQVLFADQSTTPVIVPISIRNDGAPEQVETFTVQLVNPTNGAIVAAPSSPLVTILDDEPVMVTLLNPVGDFGGRFGASLAKVGPKIAVGTPGSDGGNGRVFVISSLPGGLGGGSFTSTRFTGIGAAVCTEGMDLLSGAPGNALRVTVALGDDLVISSAGTFTSGLDGFGTAMTRFLGNILIGAPGADGGAGAVDVYDSAGSFLHTLAGEGVEALGSSFGVSDLGFVTIGLPGGTGSVHVYTGLAGGPLELDVVLDNPFPNAAAPSPAFGAAVSTMGPVIVVGAPNEDTLATNDGRAYLYDSGIGFDTWLAPGAPVSNGRFGANVLVTSSGLVCVQQAGGGPSATGRVFVLDLNGNFVAVFDAPSTAPNADFGAAMVEFDGALVIGAPRYPFLLETGAMFMFRLPLM